MKHLLNKFPNTQRIGRIPLPFICCRLRIRRLTSTVNARSRHSPKPVFGDAFRTTHLIGGAGWIRTSVVRRTADLQSAGFNHSPTTPLNFKLLKYNLLPTGVYSVVPYSLATYVYKNSVRYRLPDCFFLPGRLYPFILYCIRQEQVIL